VPRGSGLPAVIPGGLVGRTGQGPVALIDGPLNTALRGWLQRSAEPMAVGLEVPLADAARSVAQARALVTLPAPGSLVAADHLATLLVRSDRALMAALRAEALGPFDQIPPGRREPLLDTLRSWLLHAGNRADVGADLHVHPQTVSYRMDRIRELLPGQLDDPQRRWELLLALMADPPRRRG
jgi:DNA-binding PucR family transcriptional regulator